MNGERFRNWTFKVWEESVNPEYLTILENTGIPFVISPIHDKDIVEKGERKGELVKPHRHVTLWSPSKLSALQVLDIVESINGDNHIESIYKPKDMIKYLNHENRPDKAQYSRDDIIWLNCDKTDFYKDDYETVIRFIQQNDIISMNQLITYLNETGNNNYISTVVNKSGFFNVLIKEKRDSYLQRIREAFVILNKAYTELEIDDIIKSDTFKKLSLMFKDIDIKK